METNPKGRNGNVAMVLATYLSSVPLFAAALSLSLQEAQAYEPIHSASQLVRPVAETLNRVSTARVVLADYGLLRKDFPQLNGLTEAQIDEWILNKTAFQSQPQVRQSRVNTPIAVTPETTHALRPAGYGRAIVFQADETHFIDAKGTGVAPGRLPRWGGHGDGLASLGEVTREFLYEKLVQTLFTHSGSGRDTVGHYAVIDWGFDIIHEDHSTSPAGMILRQGHPRLDSSQSLFSATEARAVELNLRPYGITTAGAYRAMQSVDWINVQGTADGAILDFGAYLGVERFERDAANFGEYLPILRPGQIEFIQPRSDIRAPLQHWGTTVSGIADPKLDNPWIWSHELARNYRAGIADRRAFGRHFENLVGTYRRQLTWQPGAVAEGVMPKLQQLVEAMRFIR